MSRIGRRPIPLPSGVKVEHAAPELRVQGPKGSLSERMPDGVSIEIADGEIRFLRDDDRKPTRSAHGLARALTANMVTGVTEGFTRALEIHGVGYRAEVTGNKLKLTLGFSHPVEMDVPKGLSVSVQDNKVHIEGADKQMVGQFASDVRELRPPEPYKGKGIRYTDEHVRRKVGKAWSELRKGMKKKVRNTKLANRLARKRRVGLSVTNSRRPRLTVYRSAKHIYALLVEPGSGRTLATASTRSKTLGAEGSGNVEAAKRVGKAIAELAKNKQIDEVVFNRNGFLYHGRVKALAEAAREAGLRF